MGEGERDGGGWERKDGPAVIRNLLAAEIREQQDERVAPRTNEGRVPLRQFLVVEMKKVGRNSM